MQFVKQENHSLHAPQIAHRETMKKEIITIMFFLFLLESVLAQQAKIDIEHSGYGKTSREVYFTIHNKGTIRITNPIVYIDGEEYENIRSSLAPNGGYEIILYLDPGEYLIEVKTPEGAYDSLTITIPSTIEKPTTTIKEEKILFFQENKLYVGTIILIVILVIGIWLLTKKPELK